MNKNHSLILILVPLTVTGIAQAADADTSAAAPTDEVVIQTSGTRAITGCRRSILWARWAIRRS